MKCGVEGRIMTGAFNTTVNETQMQPCCPEICVWPLRLIPRIAHLDEIIARAADFGSNFFDAFVGAGLERCRKNMI